MFASSLKKYIFHSLIFSSLINFQLISNEQADIESSAEVVSTNVNNDLQDTSNDAPKIEQSCIINEDEFDTDTSNNDQSSSTKINDKSEEPQQIKNFLTQMEENEQCEILLKAVLTHFNTLDFDIQHIALVINNNQVRILDQRPIMNEIRSLHEIITMIQSGAFVVIKPENLGQLIELAHKLIAHIRYLLTTDLIHFQPFDFQTAQPTRSQLPQAYKFEQLEKMIRQNNALLEKLETESEHIGLSTLNKVYRKLEKLNDRYAITRKVGIATGIGAGLLWIGYLTPRYYWNKVGSLFGWKPSIDATAQDDDYGVFDGIEGLGNHSSNNTQYAKQSRSGSYGKIMVDNNPAPDIKYWVGDKAIDPRFPHPDAITTMEAEGKKIGLLTRLHDLLENNYQIITFAATPIPLFALLSPTLKEWGGTIYEWIAKKMSRFANFLRGGPVRRQMDLWAGKEIRITFDDVIGNEDAKQALAFLVSYIVDFEKYDRAGIVPETGIVLVGPPRTGKTFIAEALAGTIKAALQERGSDETIRYLPLTASELKKHGIADILIGAKMIAPVVLFIDEIDTGGFQRERDAAALGELQIAMSTLSRDKSKKVIIVAATNKPENLDFSLLEPGRFGKRIDFSYPTFNERREYLHRELAKRAVNIAPDYIDKLAHESENCSYDALNQVIVTALQRAKVRGSILTWEDLEAAYDTEINKIILDEETIPESEQYVIAVHQMGHAYMRVLLDASLELTKVTIRPTSAKIDEQAVFAKYFDKAGKKNQKDHTTIEYGHVFTAHNEYSMKLETRKDLINELIISIAGHCAEEIILGSSSNYHNDDKQSLTHDNKYALNIAKYIVFEGLQEEDLPKDIRQQKLKEAYELFTKYKQETMEILTTHKKELIVLSNILFEHKTLTAGDIEQVITMIERKNQQTQITTNNVDSDDDNDTIVEDEINEETT